MAIIIYSQSARMNALPQLPQQKALPAPAPTRPLVDENVTTLRSNDAVANEAVMAPPAPPAAPPPPVIVPEPSAAIPPATNVPPAVPAQPAPVAPAAPSPLELQTARDKPNPLLQKSSSPLDQLAFNFQSAGPFGPFVKKKNPDGTPYQFRYSDEQNNILEQVMAQPMTNPDGSPMTYKAKMKSGATVDKPMTLEKFVGTKMRDMGMDPMEAFKVVQDTLRLTSSNFMSALNSKLHYMAKHPNENEAWQKTRANRSLRKFKDYLDPKSDKYVPSGETSDIAKTFEAHAYGPIEARKEKATAWNTMFNKIKGMTNISDEANVFVDEREPGERAKKPVKKPDGTIVPGRAGKKFPKGEAMSAWMTARNVFTKFMTQHPDKAKELGLGEFLKPGGKFYLSKAMVNPAEDNVEADIETAKKGLGAKGRQMSVKPNKVDGDDLDNQGFVDHDNNHTGDEDEDSLASVAKRRTVVAAVADAIYEPEDDAALFKVAMLLSSLRIPTSDAVTASNIDTMVSWLDENKELFVSDASGSAEQKFAMAVKRVLNDCVAALDGEEAFAAERDRLRTASFVLATKLTRG